jgi:hypothetical protein
VSLSDHRFEDCPDGAVFAAKRRGQLSCGLRLTRAQLSDPLACLQTLTGRGTSGRCHYNGILVELRVLPRIAPGQEVLDPDCSRFGDWREPFALPAGVDPREFVAAARQLRVDVQIAATVSLEAQLLLETIRRLPVELEHGLAAVEQEADAAGSVASLDGRRYRQALLGQQPPAEAELEGHVLLPTRLHRRAGDTDVAAALTTERLRHGIRWELASLTAGRFIEDWGLAVIARALA